MPYKINPFTGDFDRILGPGKGTAAIEFDEDTGTANPTSAGVITIAGGSGIDTTGSGSTVTIDRSIDNFPITPYVVGIAGQAGYQTVQSAINAANTAGGGTVYIQPGAFTENLTLFASVDLWGAVGVADTAVCKIIGVHTPPSSGGVTIRNIFLESATDIFSSSAAGSTTLILIDVAIDVTNGFTFNLPNWTGSFAGFNIGEINSTNDGWVNNTGGATVFMTNITMGAGTGKTMVTSGPVELYNCVIECPINFGTGTTNLIIDGGTVFNQNIIFAGASTGAIKNCTFSTGSNPCITMSSSANWTISSCSLETSNSPSINGSGTGTLNIADLTFLNNSVIAGTVTVSYPGPTEVGTLFAQNISFDRGTNEIDTDGQLIIGSTGVNPVIGTLTAGANITITNGGGSITIAANGGGIFAITALDNTDSPYTVLAADEYLSCDVSGGVLTIDLPDAPTTGRVIRIKDSGGDANTNNISVTTDGGAVTIDGETTFTMNTDFESISVIFNGTSYEVF